MLLPPRHRVSAIYVGTMPGLDRLPDPLIIDPSEQLGMVTGLDIG
jgi:hypothetical protein